MRAHTIVGTLAMFALATSACDDTEAPVQASTEVDPHISQSNDVDSPLDDADKLIAQSFAPTLAGMRLNAAEWDRVCPGDGPGWSARADADRQYLAIADAARLGDEAALFCRVRWLATSSQRIERRFAYESLLSAQMWGFEVDPAQLEALEAGFSAEDLETARYLAREEFREVAATLAYERVHGPIPPELGEDHTIDAFFDDLPEIEKAITAPPPAEDALDVP